jgi:hypothetical protein
MAARDALDALFTTGGIRRRGSQENALGAALDTMAEPDGALVRYGHHAIYTLRPEFASAAAALGDWCAA